MERNILFGAGGHALEIYDIYMGWNIKPTVVVDREHVSSEKISALWKDARVLALEDVDLAGSLVALAIGDPHKRNECAIRLASNQKPGAIEVKFGNVVADSARVGYANPQTKRFTGLYIGHLAYVAPGVLLEPHVLVNRGSHVAHGCVLHTFATLGPCANLLGDVEVGEFANIGAGAIVLPGVKIGAHAVIGAGAVVTHDVVTGQHVAGVPARPM